MRALFWFFGTAIAAIACGSGAVVEATNAGVGARDVVDGGDELADARAAGEGEDAADAEAFVPVAHPPFSIIPNQGGPIVAHPEIITITWAGDPIAVGLEHFDDWLVTSAFWKGLMAEWGVGTGTHAASHRIATAAPATLDELGVASVIKAAIAAGKVPPPSSSRIYAVYPPAGTVVSSFGVEGCSGFQAYHSSFDYTATTDAGGASTRAIYAITPRCATTSGMSPLDYTTWGQSHEIMEAASDPLFDNGAYVITEQSLLTPELGENADLCSGHPTRVDGFMITRNWSNVAAKKGARPCVPAPAGPAFGAFADPGEILLAPGATKTVKVRAWSSAPMKPFDVIAHSADPSVKTTLSGSSANNGDELTLTLTASANHKEQVGSNLVMVYAIIDDYSVRHSLIVH